MRVYGCTRPECLVTIHGHNTCTCTFDPITSSTTPRDSSVAEVMVCGSSGVDSKRAEFTRSSLGALCLLPMARTPSRGLDLIGRDRRRTVHVGCRVHARECVRCCVERCRYCVYVSTALEQPSATAHRRRELVHMGVGVNSHAGQQSLVKVY